MENNQAQLLSIAVPPQLECSFPLKRHPRQEALVALSRSWVTSRFSASTGLSPPKIERQLKIRYDLLTCIFWPNGRSEARSLPLVKLMYWFFLVDDIIDDPKLGLGKDLEGARALCALLLGAVFGAEEAEAAGLTTGQGSSASASPCSVSKEELQLVIDVGKEWWSEMRELGMPPKQQKRLAACTGQYMRGALVFVELREQQRLPDVDEYVRLRRQDGGMAAMSVVCEFDVEVELDDATLGHPLMQSFHEAVADQVCWINDVLSFKMECASGNLVSLLGVLHHHNNKNKSESESAASTVDNFEEAVAQACAMIKARDQDCARLALEIAAWEPNLQRYVDSNLCMISAEWEWCRNDYRYRCCS